MTPINIDRIEEWAKNAVPNGKLILSAADILALCKAVKAAMEVLALLGDDTNSASINALRKSLLPFGRG